MNTVDLSGEWLSRYTYHDGVSSEHLVTFELQDVVWSGHGVDGAGSILVLRLEHDAENGVLTGTWREQTSPDGEYGGTVFHGAVQFILAATLDAADGKWVGFNSSRERVNAGDWSLHRRDNAP